VADQVVTDAQRERALVKLANAADRAQAAAGASQLDRMIAERELRQAEAEARRCGVLVTEQELIRFWKTRAWARLIDARHEVEAAKTRRPPLSAEARTELREKYCDAVAFAREWGVLR
jgi:hypothetical protein